MKMLLMHFIRLRTFLSFLQLFSPKFILTFKFFLLFFWVWRSEFLGGFDTARMTPTHLKNRQLASNSTPFSLGAFNISPSLELQIPAVIIGDFYIYI